MSEWSSVEDVLDFAIEKEEEAVQFYTGLAEKMENKAMQAVFEGFAREEQGHRQKLQGVKQTGRMEPARETVLDLKIGDYLVDVEPTPGMPYEEALILAMKKEKAAFRLYTDLAAAAGDAGVRDLFLALAQEEAKHKLRFEIEYDEFVLRDN